MMSARDLTLCMLLIFAFFCLGAQTAPDWIWASAAGGTGNDQGRAIVTDGLGNQYVTGYYSGSAAFASTTLTSSGNADIFVAKLGPQGTWLWAVSAGGASDDHGYAIALDSESNLYITGDFWGSAAFGATTLTSNGSIDVFAAKLDSSGNWLWARNAGGANVEYGYGIALDPSGNLLLTGHYSGTTGFGTYTSVSAGLFDIFVAKLDQSGNWLWLRSAGGSGFDYSYGIGVDDGGNAYISGYYDVSAAFGSLPAISNGGSDVYVAKLSPGGTWLWVASAGGTSSDYCYGLAVDGAGNAYPTGQFWNQASFGAANLVSNGNYEVFIAKVSSGGNWLWAESAGGSGGDYSNGAALDESGRVYLTGFFWSQAEFGPVTLNSTGSFDTFVAALDDSGAWLWAKSAGGTGFERGFGIDADAQANVFVTGSFMGFASFGFTLLVSGGGEEVYAALITDPHPLPPANPRISHNGNDVLLEWDPVTQNTAFQFITPDAYRIYVNSGADPLGDYTYLGQTSGTSFVHSGAVWGTGFRFYKVVAVQY